MYVVLVLPASALYTLASLQHKQAAAQRCSATASFEQPLGQVLGHHEPLLVPACQPWSTEADHCCSLLVSAPSPPAPVIDQIASPLEAQTEAQKEQKLFRRRARGFFGFEAEAGRASY